MRLRQFVAPLLRKLTADLDAAQTKDIGILAICDAAEELNRIGNPHPHVDTGRDDWLPFLASAIAVAKKVPLVSGV